ncbi:MAG: hypothetical protein FWD94_07820 [Treponema sp.]|nr:hypothetical protein [Treponema sp.]
MEERKDGGAAFPLGISVEGEEIPCNYGMSLRDWFAGQALVGVLAGLKPGEYPYGEIVRSCYLLADAMIWQREEVNNG